MKLPYDSLFPTVKRGFVKGLLRLEKHGGGDDLYLPWNGPIKDFAPLTHNGHVYGVSGLQKKSCYGWLQMQPFICYAWKTWKPQQQDENGGWVSGTEIVSYFRSPGYRKDFASTNGHYWVWTNGYISPTHYD